MGITEIRELIAEQYRDEGFVNLLSLSGYLGLDLLDGDVNEKTQAELEDIKFETLNKLALMAYKAGVNEWIMA